MGTPSNPGFVTGQQPSASQWNGYFSTKADYNGDGSFATVESSGTATLGSGSANYLTISGATTGNAPTITAAGSDANINVSLTPKGSGSIFSTSGILCGSAGFTPFSHVSWLQTSGGTLSGQAFYDGISAFGTVTSGNAFFREFAVNSDSMSSVGGAAGIYIGHTISAGAVGGRNGLQILLNQTGATSLTTGNTYYVGIGTVAQGSASAGGVSGTPAGNLFGSNSVAQLLPGAGLYWESLISDEADVSVASGIAVVYKVGHKVVQLTSDAVAGTSGDYAYSINNQVGGSQPGWRVGFSFGAFEGVWAIATTGTMVGTTATALGGPSYAAATGIDFSAVTFSTAFLKSKGFLVDGSGNTTLDTLTMTGNTINLPNGNTTFSTSSNNSAFAIQIWNNYVGTNVQAVLTLTTGTPNAYAESSLHDNNGSPYLQHSTGVSITGVYYDASYHGFRNASSVPILGLNTSEITCSTLLALNSYTVATLPSAPVQGATAYVTDATSPTFLGTLTGGGSVKCPVFYNGSAWVAG